MKIPSSPFVTRFSGNAKEIELRLRNVFQWKKKATPVLPFFAAVLMVAFCCSLVGVTPQEKRDSELLPGKNGVLAVEEIPGGTVYATGRFGSANLYWLPDGATVKNAKLVRESIPNVDLSTLTLTCEDNILRLRYLQMDVLVDLDFHWDDMLKTIRYRMTGKEPEQYPLHNTLIDLDVGRNNMWVTTRYRVAEDMLPEYIDSGGVLASKVDSAGGIVHENT